MPTEEELQAEIDRLREHSDKLLAEKKKAVSESTKLQESLDKLTAEIERRDEAPINDVFAALAPSDNLTGYLRQEFGHHFKIVKSDDGEMVIHDSDDKPVELDGEACRFDAATVQKLVTRQKLDSLMPLIKSSGASGGGAQQSARVFTRPSKDDSEAKEDLQFGLR